MPKFSKIGTLPSDVLKCLFISTLKLPVANTGCQLPFVNKSETSRTIPKMVKVDNSNRKF